MSLIELKHITKRFGRQLVLDDVSLEIEACKCLVIIGASGSGKSVMLKTHRRTAHAGTPVKSGSPGRSGSTICCRPAS